MKLLAIAASNSPESINRSLLGYAIEQIASRSTRNVESEVLDLNQFDMHIYSINREHKAGIPNLAHRLFNLIGAADALLVSFAEHNGSVTAAWKNTFDWMSRIETKVWQDKPMVMLAASPGSRAGESVLTNQAMLAPHFGADVLGHLGIGDWNTSWNSSKKHLTREADIKALDTLLSKLISE